MQSKTITYKNTNNDFVPLIPDHWELIKIKYLFNIGRGRVIGQNELKDDGKYPVYSSQTSNDGILGYINTFDFNEELLTWTTDGVNAGTVFHRIGKFNTTNICGTLKPTTNNYIRFQYYSLFIVAPLCKRPDTNGAKIMNNEMANIKIPLPPFEEQVKIANYLDVKCEQINQFITDKKQLIKLLKEQRQSVIDDYFIGIKTIVKLKYLLTKMGSGVTPKGGANVYKPNGIYFLRSQNIHNDGLRLDNVAFITKDVHRNMFSSQIQKNDVLINITGASIGRCYVYLLEEEANINQHICILRPDLDLIIPEFLMYQIQSTRIQNLIDMVEGASREGLTNFVLKNYPIAITDIEEQKNIVSNIKNDIKIIDETIAKTEEELKLVTEYKEALISNAVTGQIQLT